VALCRIETGAVMSRQHATASRRPTVRQRCACCGVPEGKPHKPTCPAGRCSRCGAARAVLALCASCGADVREIAEKPW
jgi:hypothetical protein